MVIWTDDPVHDAEMYMMEQPEVIGHCEFCLEQVLKGEEVYKDYKTGEYAHKECVQEAIERINKYV